MSSKQWKCSCPYTNRECFAFSNGDCTALSKEPTSDECPFFKTREEFSEGLADHPYEDPSPDCHRVSTKRQKKIEAMIREINFPKCDQGKYDCKFLKGDRCTILTGIPENCSFYKK